jgi:hypothetical protein
MAGICTQGVYQHLNSDTADDLTLLHTGASPRCVRAVCLLSVDGHSLLDSAGAEATVRLRILLAFAAATGQRGCGIRPGGTSINTVRLHHRAGAWVGIPTGVFLGLESSIRS